MLLKFLTFSPVKLLKRKLPRKLVLSIQSRMSKLEKLKSSKDQILTLTNLTKCMILRKEFSPRLLLKSKEEKESIQERLMLRLRIQSTKNDVFKTISYVYQNQLYFINLLLSLTPSGLTPKQCFIKLWVCFNFLLLFQPSKT